MTPAPPAFLDPTIGEMIAERIDLHEAIDTLVHEYERQYPPIRLTPRFSSYWSRTDLSFDLVIKDQHESITCDVAEARTAAVQLASRVLDLLLPFLKKYPQATVSVRFDSGPSGTNSFVTLHFQ